MEVRPVSQVTRSFGSAVPLQNQSVRPPSGQPVNCSLIPFVSYSAAEHVVAVVTTAADWWAGG